jgi:hypothetical protein
MAPDPTEGEKEAQQRQTQTDRLDPTIRATLTVILFHSLFSYLKYIE